MKEAEKKNKTVDWIDVTERLPDGTIVWGAVVYKTDKGKSRVYLCEYHCGSWYECFGGSDSLSITHWKPFTHPEPPILDCGEENDWQKTRH